MATTEDPKCQVSAIISTDFSTTKKDDVEKFEKYSGYSECEYYSIKSDTVKLKCRKPASYEMITTTNMAKCHQFLKGMK